MNRQSDPVIEKLKKQVVEAARQEDISLLQKLVELWLEHSQLQTQQVAFQEKLATLHEVGPKAQEDATANGLRRVLVEITGGAVRQSYLALTRAVKRGLIKRGENFRIEVPATGSAFDTGFARRAKFLAERKGISDFFAAANVKEGDFVELREIKPNHWKLTKTAPPDLSEYF